MEKILFILGGYINRTSQNGICVEDIKNEMEKLGVEVHVLCIESDYPLFENIDNNIHVIKKRKTSNKFSALFKKVIKFFNMPLENIILIKKIERRINTLFNIHNYNSLISVVNPTETAEALYRFKKKNMNIQFILYEIDPASNRYKNPKGIIERIWKNRVTRWEKKIYKYANYVIHMKTHSVHFSSDHYKNFIDKTIYLDIPSYNTFLPKTNVNLNKRMLSIIYAGNFYPALRNPDYMLKVLSELSKIRNIELYIYTGENMINHIKKLVHQMEGDIVVNNMVPQSVLNEHIDKSDIVISVGNFESDFLPSKIFYYISNGKPIIHFYSSDNDVSIPYLRKYPYALLLDQKTLIKENVNKIIIFIEKLKNEVISGLDFTEIYLENTPKYTAIQLLELIRK